MFQVFYICAFADEGYRTILMIVIWGHPWPNPHLPSKFQPLLTIYTVVMGVTIPQRVSPQNSQKISEQ